MSTMQSFALTAQDSWAFAGLSGDFNPLHVDPIAARRLQFGGTICHGVHLVLKAMDLAAAAGLLVPAEIDTVSAVFASSVRTGSPVLLEMIREPGSNRLRLLASSDGRGLFTAKLTLASPFAAGPLPLQGEPAAAAAPRCPDFPSTLPPPSLAAAAVLSVNGPLFQRLLPTLAAHPQGLQLTADLLATTRIVGMELPGLHSIYSEFKLQRRAPAATAPDGTMAYRVQRADPRFRSVRIAVAGGTLAGTLEALFRAPPVAQAKLSDLRSSIDPQRFAGQRALVVGGSRGLGELAAKILLAGGAQVTLSHAQGQADAQRIQHEALAAGLDVNVLHIDASQPLPEGLVSQLGSAGLTHLYHFATPKISKNADARWSPALFERYCQLYVHGFSALVLAAAPRQPGPTDLQVLYPSTVFLDQPEAGFAEYCAAKSAGESVCDHLGLLPGVVVHKPRLPRLQTDQNSSFLGVQGAAPLALMLSLLQTMQPVDGFPNIPAQAAT